MCSTAYLEVLVCRRRRYLFLRRLLSLVGLSDDECYDPTTGELISTYAIRTDIYKNCAPAASLAHLAKSINIIGWTQRISGSSLAFEVVANRGLDCVGYCPLILSQLLLAIRATKQSAICLSLCGDRHTT